MMTSYPLLTEDQIKTQFHIMPPELFRFALGEAVYVEYLKQKKAIEADGGCLEIIFWPNGTTILWSRPDPDLPLAVDKLIEHYHQFHHDVALAERRTDYANS